jgi:hypothetical protein
MLVAPLPKYPLDLYLSQREKHLKLYLPLRPGLKAGDILNSPQVAQPQKLKSTTWEPRRACRGVAASMHATHRRSQSYLANLVSITIAEVCAIHVRPPPDHPQTAPGPPRECRRQNEECPDTPPQCPRLPRILHSAFFLLPSPKPPQSHINATSKPPQCVLKARR